MANIKNMQMGDAICGDARIGIRKGLLGLTTKYVYLPTESLVKGEKREVDEECGKRLLQLLQSPTPQPLADKLRLAEAVNGNYLVEIAYSADKSFVALHVLRYDRLNYEPVAPVRIYEGDEARAISQIL